MSKYAILKDRGLIHVSGPDAKTFLQGIITNDIQKLTPELPLYTAFLTPQGKYLHDFFIYASKDTLFIDCEIARLEDLMKRLKMHKLRSKATIEDISEAYQVISVLDTDKPTDPPAECLLWPDPRLSTMGWRGFILNTALTDIELTDLSEYETTRMQNALPDGSRDMPVERAIILEYGLDDLNALDWQKGCYMGQELMAKTKHRGEIRKRLFPVAITGEVPAFNTALTYNGQKAGKMRSHNGEMGLALLYIDVAKQSMTDQQPIEAENGAKLTPRIPEWMQI